MAKFRRLQQYLVEQGIVSNEDFCRPSPPDDATLFRTHERRYVEEVRANKVAPRDWRRIGLPWSPELVRRTHLAVAGTLLTARLALRYGLACHAAGGTHHAFPGHGSGFCIFNDLAFAARTLLFEGRVNRLLIVDLDVHQGDGTHRFFRSDPRVYTFSMHGAKNFPVRREPGDRDVELPDGTGDEDYLAVLREELPKVNTAAQPDLVLFDAGVDPHQDDALGRLRLSDRGLERREEMVIDFFVSRAIPLAAVIGGGYDRDLDALVRRHAILHRVARSRE